MKASSFEVEKAFVVACIFYSQMLIESQVNIGTSETLNKLTSA